MTDEQKQYMIKSHIKTAIEMLDTYDSRTCDIKAISKILQETLMLLTEK